MERLPVSFRLREDVIDVLADLADRLDLTMTEVVSDALKRRKKELEHRESRRRARRGCTPESSPSHGEHAPA